MVKTKTSTAGNDGFTLFELIVVLFIAGLLFSVVFVSVGRLHEKAVLQKEVRALYTTLRHARETALLERRETVFSADIEKSEYGLAQGDAVIHDHSLPPGMALSGETSIRFFPKGNSSGGKLTIGNEKGKKYSVEVDPELGTAKITGL